VLWLRFLARLIILLDPALVLEVLPEVLAPPLGLLPGLTPRIVESGATGGVGELEGVALGVVLGADTATGEPFEVVAGEVLAKEGVPFAPHCQLGITVWEFIIDCRRLRYRARSPSRLGAADRMRSTTRIARAQSCWHTA